MSAFMYYTILPIRIVYTITNNDRNKHLKYNIHNFIAITNNHISVSHKKVSQIT